MQTHRRFGVGWYGTVSSSTRTNKEFFKRNNSYLQPSFNGQEKQMQGLMKEEETWIPHFDISWPISVVDSYARHCRPSNRQPDHFIEWRSFVHFDISGCTIKKPYSLSYEQLNVSTSLPHIYDTIFLLCHTVMVTSPSHASYTGYIVPHDNGWDFLKVDLRTLSASPLLVLSSFRRYEWFHIWVWVSLAWIRRLHCWLVHNVNEGYPTEDVFTR